VNLCSALSCGRLQLEGAPMWPVCNKGITQFYLTPTDAIPAFTLSSRKVLRSFWLVLPTRDGQAEWSSVAGYMSI